MMINEEKITIPFSSTEQIEGIISYPERIRDNRAVLLCSPHPHFAGNMDNNVITSLYRFFSEKGLPVLRYNYRGAGGSTLNLHDDMSIFDYWNDVEENKKYDKTIIDTVACLNFLQDFNPGSRISVVGYSFGAIMAMLVGCSQPGVDSIAGIAPPLTEYDFSPVGRSEKRTYLAGSSGDFVYDRDQFISLCEGMSNLNGYDFFEDCDHFFRGKEGELNEAVWNFMEDDMR